MSVSCTWTRARRQHAARHRRGGPCPHRPVEAQGLEYVLQRVDQIRTMSTGEVINASLVLGLPVPSRRMDVLKARLRVAVRLEELGG